MKVNKPPVVFLGYLHLKYRGKNHNFFQKRSLSKIQIIEIDYKLKEELVVSLTTFDGTEIKFSMISSNLYVKTNNEYKLQEVNEEQEQQSFCSFELLFTDNLMLFDGFLSYNKNFEGLFSFKEDFEATITVNENHLLLQTWIKHEQIIIN